MLNSLYAYLSILSNHNIAKHEVPLTGPPPAYLLVFDIDPTSISCYAFTEMLSVKGWSIRKRAILLCCLIPHGVIQQIPDSSDATHLRAGPRAITEVKAPWCQKQDRYTDSVHTDQTENQMKWGERQKGKWVECVPCPVSSCSVTREHPGEAAEAIRNYHDYQICWESYPLVANSVIILTGQGEHWEIPITL